MNTGHWILRTAVGAAAALACSTALAAPVDFNLQGAVSGYDNGTVDLPIGAAVSLSLSFNETFSDGTFDFSDVLGPVSGSLSVAGRNYSLNAARAFSYGNDPSGALRSVQLQFTGSGPAVGGGDFFGFFANITPGLTLFSDVSIGYGFTTDYGVNGSVTSYRYAMVSASNYAITPAGPTQVAVPATLPLVLLGLMGLPAVTLARRRAG